MSLLLCRLEPVQHPYYVEVLGIHIYSSQELCYIIYNNPLLVMEDFSGHPSHYFYPGGAGYGASCQETPVPGGPEE